MTVKWDMSNVEVIATSKQTIATAVTTAFDFGTPDNVDLPALSLFGHGDRVMVVLTASTAGSTANLTWVIQDADDSAGAIGTPATATTSAIAGALAATTGDDYSVFAVQVQPNRPWLKISATNSGTDSFVCHCVVLGIPNIL